MRMHLCPRCGAQNSTRRARCHQCGQELTPAEPGRPTPASRWEAIEPLDSARAAQGLSVSPDRPPASPRATLRDALPQRRQAIGYVRRMGVLFRQLQALTQSGISLGAACRELERRAPRPLRPLAADMARATFAGEPISAALERHRALLYPWHIGLVQSAEAGGFLPEAFDQIAHAYEVEWETRSALRLRLFVYAGLGVPAVLLSLPAILTLAAPIPPDGWTPQSVIESLSANFRQVSLPIALGLVAATLIWQALQSTGWFQAVQQRAVLSLPLVGRVARSAALDRYLAALGLMLRAGLPIAQAAERAALAAGNAALTPRLLGLIPELRKGTPLSDLLAETRLFDPDAMNLTATGEATGDLPDMLTRAARYYREENEARRRMLLRAAQVAFGACWLSLLGLLAYLGLRTYFDFAFRTLDWMMEGFE